MERGSDETWGSFMSKPKVILTRRWPAEVELSAAQDFELTVNAFDAPLTRPQLREAMEQFDALCPTVSDRIDAEVLCTRAARARIIGSYGAGFNHIDLAAAKAAGLAVTNTPDVLTGATADLAMTLMLMAARRAGEGEREVRSGAWTGWRPTHLLGTQLSGKRLGLVGFGRIARATAERARNGFGMSIAFYNRSHVHLDWADRVESLHELLSSCDFISIHVPGGAETRQLINRAAINAMRSHTILVNTARGDIIDEGALSDALASGRIRAAGLDVYAKEPNVPSSLLALENVVLLPHLGSATEETRVAMGMRVLDNLRAFFAGKEPRDRVC